MLLRAARAAAVAALVSWGVLVLLTVVGWLSTSATTTGFSSAVGVGSLVWSVANLGAVSDGTTTISLVPLGLVAWPLAVVALAARALAPFLEADDSARLDAAGGMRRDSATALLGFTGTYAGLGIVLSQLGRLVPVHAVWWQTLLGTVAVAVVGLVVGLRRVVLGPDLAPLWRDQVLAVAPVSVRRGAAVGSQGAAALLAAGAVPVLVSLVARWGQVAQVHRELDAGVVGGALLVLGQLLLVPNLAAWGLSWLAGPGFSVGTGAVVTWTHSSSVVLPNIPVLGALPDPGAHSPWWSLVVLVPVAVGVLVGHRALGTVSRLSSVVTKAQAVGVAVASAALLCLLALVLSGGALGTQALADVGPRAVTSALALAGELTLGALGALVWSVVRFNRGRR